MDFLQKNAKEGDLSGTLSSWVSFWLDNQARGGLMLGPDEHDHLAKLNGDKRFRDSRALVRAVEKGLNRDEGQFNFSINIDPAHIQPLEQFAVESGMTVQELVQNSTAMVFAQGWLYDCTPVDGRMIPFTRKMIEDLAALSGNKTMNSADIGNMISAGQLLPLSNALVKQAQRVTGKLEVSEVDFASILDELESLRALVKELGGSDGDREMVAA